MIFHPEELQLSVPLRFGRVAARYPRAVAVRFANRETSYEELDRASDQVAFRLLEMLGEREEPVPFLLEPGAELPLAVLGILKAGKAYVALDPQDSDFALNHLLTHLKARVLVTHSDLAHRQVAVSRLQIDRCQADPIELPQRRENDLASIIFSSGSSGRPKGVERGHGALLHRAYLYQCEHGIGPGDRQALLAAAHFVACETDMLGPLLTGATLCPFPMHPLRVADMVGWLESEAITLLHPPVSFFRRLVAKLPEEVSYPHLRLLALGGEPVAAEEIASWRGKFPPTCRWVHRYSSSEAGNITSLTLDDQDSLGALPAGYPCLDKTVRVVDDSGCPVPAGGSGEVVVVSPYLSLGYWNDPEATRACFQDGSVRTGDRGRLSAQGLLTLEGRMDGQVKVRGHRVDLTALEAALLSHPAVREAAVVVDDAETLVAHLVPVGPAIELADLGRYVQGILGQRHRPDRIEQHSHLPLNRNGKLDRLCLRIGPQTDSSQGTSAGAGARSGLEHRLQVIWQARLGMATGPDDSFFAKGGTSLTALEILTDIEREMGIPMEPSVLAQAPTPRQMAALLQGGESRSTLVPIQTGGTKPPLFLIHPNHGQVLPFFPLAQRLGPDQPVFALRARGLLRSEPLPSSMAELAEDYLAQIRTVQPHGPYHLAGRCFGASVAVEMAMRLLAEGEEVRRLVVIDGPGPLPRLSPAAEAWRRVRLRVRWLKLEDPVALLGKVMRRLRPPPRRKGGGASSVRPFRAMIRHCDSLRQFYSCPNFPGEIAIIHGQDRMSRACVLNWSRLAQGRVRLYPLACGHRQVLHEPFLREVARYLRELL